MIINLQVWASREANRLRSIQASDEQSPQLYQRFAMVLRRDPYKVNSFSVSLPSNCSLWKLVASENAEQTSRDPLLKSVSVLQFEVFWGVVRQVKACSVCSNTDLTDWLLNAAYMYYWSCIISCIMLICIIGHEVSVLPTASPLWSLSWSLLSLQTFMRNELLLGRDSGRLASHGDKLLPAGSHASHIWFNWKRIQSWGGGKTGVVAPSVGKWQKHCWNLSSLLFIATKSDRAFP